MATNAIISITKNNEVITKIICGCDGDRAEKVAREIIKYMAIGGDPTNIVDIYEICREFKLGCEDCLFVMNSKGYYFDEDDEDDAETMKRYRDTFDDPEFNPRTKDGKGASYTFIIPSYF